MMHLVGAGSGLRAGRNLAGVEKKHKIDSKALKFNQKQGQDPEEDNAVKKIQGQLNALRQKLQDISESETMDPKTKAELIQNTKEEMAQLSQQLEQRRVELREEQLKKEEEAQKNGMLPNSDKSDSDKSKSTGKSKYDSYSEDDEVSAVNAAVMAANGKVDMAERQRFYRKYKNGQIRILNRQIITDTKEVHIKQVGGHETKTVEKALEYNANYLQGEAAERAQAALDKGRAEHNPGLNKEVGTVVFDDIWEMKRGFAVDKKTEEIGKLKSEISGLRKTEAQSLGEANRIIDDTKVKEDEESEENDKSQLIVEEDEDSKQN